MNAPVPKCQFYQPRTKDGKVISTFYVYFISRLTIMATHENKLTKQTWWVVYSRQKSTRNYYNRYLCIRVMALESKDIADFQV